MLLILIHPDADANADLVRMGYTDQPSFDVRGPVAWANLDSLRATKF